MGKERRPLEWTQATLSSVEKLRWLGCPTYSTCLLEAARLLWAGFSCKECPRWDGLQTPLESDPFLTSLEWEELEGLLLRRGFNGKRKDGG